MTVQKNLLTQKIFKGNYELSSVLEASLIIHCKYKHHSLLKMFPHNHIKHPFGLAVLTSCRAERNLHFNSVKQTCHRDGDNPVILLAHLVAFNPVNTSDNHFF